MLKEIIIILLYEEKEINAKVLKKRLSREGILARIIPAQEAGSLLRVNTDPGILLITDSSSVFLSCASLKLCAAVYFHELNGEEDFAGVSQAVLHLEELEVEDLERIYLRLAGLPWSILETDRLRVRETTVEDVDELYRIYAHPSITRYMEPLFEDREEEKRYAEEYIRQIYGFYGYGMWSVLEQRSGRVIGRAGISFRAGFDVPELGFVIEKDCQRQGYGEEVCRAILEYGKDQLKFDEVQAMVRRENTASAALCLKLGFRMEESVVSGAVEYDRYLKQL